MKRRAAFIAAIALGAIGSTAHGFLPMGQFTNVPNPYVINSGVNLTLELLPGAPTNGNVVFQVWSNAANALQATFLDTAAPFVYPASSLNQVTPGGAEIQALIRNSSNQVVEIVRFSTSFLAPGPAPTPSIFVNATSGVAPFAVHVHGLNSSLGVGTQNTARYEWTFGDPSGAYNTINGWNAAHVYNQPGTYTITLKITNESGAWATATKQISISSSNRSTIYVSPTGSDSNSGTSEASPVQTFAKAASMLANNRAILFKRGGTYNTSSTMWINQQNVLIGAYGSGSDPTLFFTSSATYAKFIELGTTARDVVIENLRFDSGLTPNNLIVRAIHPHGVNVVVRNCRFEKVSYALNCGGSNGVNGLLVQNNTAAVLGAYFSWAEGSNHVYLGNTVAGSVDEHNIRLGNATRVLIAHNDLTNNSKSTIWAMLGSHCYISKNTLRYGRFIAGPNYATSTLTERFPWLVFEGNRIINQGVILYSGAENMMLRNNVITYNGGECFSIWGYISSWDRTCKNIVIASNTATNSSQSGKFIKLGEGAENITVANNLYCANAISSQSGAGNVVFVGANLNGHSFHHNYWANPTSGTTVHSVGGVLKTAPQWATYSQTSSEQYRTYTAADLSAQFAPQFNASMGAAVQGVMTDFYDHVRPLNGPLTIGAVESTAGGSSPTPDINNDGHVDANDLLIVINQWGICGTLCPADINQDSIVNVTDLLIVINAWG